MGKTYSINISDFGIAGAELNWLTLTVQGKYHILNLFGFLYYLDFGITGTHIRCKHIDLSTAQFSNILHPEWAWFKPELPHANLVHTLGGFGFDYIPPQSRFVFNLSLRFYTKLGNPQNFGRFQTGFQGKVGYTF